MGWSDSFTLFDWSPMPLKFLPFRKLQGCVRYGTGILGTGTLYTVEYLQQQYTASTAQHSAITLAQSSKPSTYVPIRVHIKRSMHVHAYGVRVVFLEHGALGVCKSPVLHLKCWTIYYICHSVPFFLVSERSGRNRCTGTRSALYNTRYM